MGARGTLWRRWVVAVTVGELVGFALPAVVGALAVALGLPDWCLLALIVPAGMGEGAILAMAQWWVLHRVVPRLERRAWVVATALAAGGAYSLWMVPMQLTGWLSWPPVLGAALLGGLGAAFVLAMGGAQWLVLRRVVPRCGHWIVTNALAWPLGVAVPVVAITAVPDGLPPVAFIVVGLLGGLGMGLVVGAITGWSVMRLARAAAHPTVGAATTRHTVRGAGQRG